MSIEGTNGTIEICQRSEWWSITHIRTQQGRNWEVGRVITEQDKAISLQTLRRRLYFARRIDDIDASNSELRRALVELILPHTGSDGLWAACHILHPVEAPREACEVTIARQRDQPDPHLLTDYQDALMNGTRVFYEGRYWEVIGLCDSRYEVVFTLRLSERQS